MPCTCFPTPPHMWTTHYGAVEPGSALERNPYCPVHGTPAPPCVIVDVDGTLVDVSGVRHYVMADPRRKDFDSFHAAALWCPPVPGVLEVVHGLQDAGIAVVVMTSRRRHWEDQTRTWLAVHGVAPALLAMRADGDRRRDAEVKQTLLERVAEQFEPVLAIDDNPSIVALWRDHGIPTVRVPGWIEQSA